MSVSFQKRVGFFPSFFFFSPLLPIVIVLKNLWLFKVDLWRDPHHIAEVSPQSKILTIYSKLSFESLERSLWVYVKNTKIAFIIVICCMVRNLLGFLEKWFEEFVIYTQCVTSQKLTRGEESMTMRSYDYPAEELTKMVLDFSNFFFAISCLLSSFIGFFGFFGFFFVGENFKSNCMKPGS